ncbi:MAG: hypothetical protein R3305_06540, partial [Gammaproteobacteria bacterium]|nr:hypothetical protein [Gammaproteobacteria bacterium]
MDGIDANGLVATALKAALNYRFRAETEAPRRSEGDDDSRPPAREAVPADAEQRLRYERSEKSVLRIRTQEGDVVALKIRAGESLKVSVGAEGDDDDGVTIAETRVVARSSTRVSLKVKGDLNEAELAAIRDVFAQATALAEDFFSGDYAAAFETASALAIDGDQLARVSLRLKVREALTYSGPA